MWKVLMKDVDLVTSFFVHFFSFALNGESEKSKHIVENLCWSYRKDVIFWEIWRKHFFMVLWYGRSCKEMHGTILWMGEQNNSNSFSKSQHQALSNTNSMKTWYFFGQQINLHEQSANGPKLVTNDWIVWYLTSITHMNINSIVMWGKTAKQCRLGLLQDSDFAGDLEDSKSTSGGTLCIFGSHTFVPTSWMFKTQTSVSHSSTESEIVSLDAGFRMDGIPALDLGIWSWKCFIPNRTEQMESHGKSRRQLSSQKCITPSQSSTPTSFQHTLVTLHQIQRIQVRVLFCMTFLDIEAAIKMVIKGLSCTMRHVLPTLMVIFRIRCDSEDRQSWRHLVPSSWSEGQHCSFPFLCLR